MSSFQVGTLIGKGGEGSVYSVVGNPNEVFKEFDPIKLTPTKRSGLLMKLNYMYSNQPKLKNNAENKLAWPTFVVVDGLGNLEGYIMPRLHLNMRVHDVHEKQDFDNMLNMIVASNLCGFVDDMHRNNIVIGDFNHGNVGVFAEAGNPRSGVVSMMDCDSFHLEKGKYPCVMGYEGYISPEHLKRMDSLKSVYYDVPIPTFTKNTDLFALAVHVFRLLMGSVSPFNGVDTSNKGASSAVASRGDDSIRKGLYVLKAGITPFDVGTPPACILSDELINLFNRAFVTGEPRLLAGQKSGELTYHENEIVRPTALEFQRAVDNYISQQSVCFMDDTHYYYKSLISCPWCEQEERNLYWKTQRRIISSFGHKDMPSWRVRRWQ